jgi:hypothetical protein
MHYTNFKHHKYLLNVFITRHFTYNIKSRFNSNKQRQIQHITVLEYHIIIKEMYHINLIIKKNHIKHIYQYHIDQS